ncbi:MFHAS1 [Branchiostoma lanceolatum]|uniref:non-specific serine/threonine protein kinase n=1 Tax=Branchiostoma lanceolatum TaxID=7740 RepID=A0A8J9V6F8_BRALA|nr:MFHAS1 [Branchiostoma lanceolatum]
MTNDRTFPKFRFSFDEGRSLEEEDTSVPCYQNQTPRPTHMKPLHAAVIKGDQRRVSQLVQEGEDVDGRCECKLPDLKRAHEFTPLHCAAAVGDLGVIDLLVAAGAQVDSEDEVGCSPLHRAVWYNKFDVVQALLAKYGANKNKKNLEGYTPLHLAAKAGHLEILNVLLKTGVNLDIVDKVGRTATDHAKENGHLDVVKLLEECSSKQDASSYGYDKTVRLTDHSLSRIPDDVLEKEEVEDLFLSRNRLSVLPSNFTRLGCLTKLYLDNNCLSAFPSELFALSELEELSLADNNIDNLPEQISVLRKMKTLLVFGNLLHSLPNSIGSLSLLESFDAHRNCLKELPTSFAQLQNLKHLYLSHNQFEEVPDVALNVGNSLQVLEVAMNKLRRLPEAIDRLKVIERIDAGENKIATVPKTLCNLSRLQWLSVMDNCIQELPDTFGQLASSLKYLSTTNNPLVQPPYEVCQQGVQAILEYQKELERCKAVVQPKMKMVLLGSPFAGKTSLCHALMEEKSRLTKEKDRTHCMDVKLWQADRELQLEVYDFGGHKVYDFVHQFFLSPLAMNVLTVDLERYQPAEFERMVGKWAKALNAHTPGAVIRVVGTHVDRCSPKDVRLKCEDICDQLHRDKKKQDQIIQDQMKTIEDVISDSSVIDVDHPLHGVTRERMLKRYHKLRAMLQSQPKLQWCVAPVSSADPLKGIEDLKKELVSLALNKDVFPALRRVLPETWVNLEQRLLAERKKSTLWLAWEEVETLGRETGLSPDRLHPAVAYLHKRGVVLHFHDIPDLNNVVFHNPARLTDILKQLYHHDTDTMIRNIGSLKVDHIQQRQLQEDLLRSGLMSVDTLHHLLHGMKHPPNNMDIVVKLLERFGICYPVPMSGAGSIARAYRTESCSMYQFTWFLSADMPGDVHDKWLPVCPEVQDQLTVLCVMRGFTPWGLYERFCAQIDPHIGNRLDWANGILASFGDFPLHVTRDVNKENNASITMATRFPTGSADEAWEGLLKVYGVLRSLLKEWPGLPYTFWIGCCHCLKKEDATRAQPHYFPGDLLRQRRPLGIQSLRCRRCSASETVDIRLVYPPSVTEPSKQSAADAESAFSTNGEQATCINNTFNIDIEGSSNIQIGTGNEIQSKVSKAGKE